MNIRPTRAKCAYVALCLALFVTNLSAAEDKEPRGAITLAQALDAALAINPELAASRYELNAAQARIVHARSRSPEIRTTVRRFGRPSPSMIAPSSRTARTLGMALQLLDGGREAAERPRRGGSAR